MFIEKQENTGFLASSHPPDIGGLFDLKLLIVNESEKKCCLTII